jgi:MoxR-like ATPase
LYASDVQYDPDRVFLHQFLLLPVLKGGDEYPSNNGKEILYEDYVTILNAMRKTEEDESSELKSEFSSYLSNDDFKMFLKALAEMPRFKPDFRLNKPPLSGQQFQLGYRLLYNSALKISDLLKLKVKDIDLENQIIKNLDSTEEFQETTILPEDIEIIKQYISKMGKDEVLFPTHRHIFWVYAKESGRLANLKIFQEKPKKSVRGMDLNIFRDSRARLMSMNGAREGLIRRKLRLSFTNAIVKDDIPTIDELKEWERIHSFNESEEEINTNDQSIRNNLNLKSFKNSKLVFPPNLNEVKNEIQKQLLIPGDIIDRIIFSLYSGKHVILTGPVGTGKTHLAQLIPKIAWSKIGGYYPETVTATSEWTTQDVIGGIFPKTDGDVIKYSIQKGCVSDTISKNWLDESGKLEKRIKFEKEGVEYNGVWLVIDEFNRANIDRAFGSLFTAFEYKKLKIPTTKPNESYEELTIPEDYRIIGTLNTFDKHFLFRLSDALKRRFSFIEILPPTYDKILEEIRFVSEKALENYDEIKEELKIQNFEDLRKNPDAYSLLTNLYEIMAFVRFSKNLGTAVLISMFRFALINYLKTKNLDNSLDAAVLTHLLPHLESLQYWQIDSIMNFVGGRIHEMFRKFDVNKHPDVNRYEEEFRNLTRYLRLSGTNKSAGNWIAKFRTGEIFKSQTPISDLDPWSNKKRPILQRFRESLEVLKKEKGYFEDSEGLNE